MVEIIMKAILMKHIDGLNLNDLLKFFSIYTKRNFDSIMRMNLREFLENKKSFVLFNNIYRLSPHISKTIKVIYKKIIKLFI